MRQFHLRSKMPSRTIAAVYMIGYIIFIGVSLSPIFQPHDGYKSQATKSDEYLDFNANLASFRNRIEKSFQEGPGGSTEDPDELFKSLLNFHTLLAPTSSQVASDWREVAAIRQLNVSINPLVSAAIDVKWKFSYEDDPRWEEAMEVKGLRVEYDKVIVYTGMWLVVLLLFYSLYRPSHSLGANPGTTKKEINNSSDKPERTHSLENRDTIQIIEQEVRNAQNTSEGMYVRSTILLTAGILMAFIGVALFYVTVPSADHPFQELMNTFMAVDAGLEFANIDGASIRPTDFDWSRYLAKSLRPIGMLIFIEAIAWFLLRQYRSTTEDYKAFHRLYLKRANYLIAFKSLAESKSEEVNLFLAGSILQEDLSGRLQQGESTEALETMRTPEANPILNLLASMLRTNSDKIETQQKEKQD